jgi:hypothetical protein
VRKRIRVEIPSETPNATPPAPVVTPGHSVPAATFLRKVADWDGNSPNIDQVLTAAFEADDYLDCVKDLKAQNIDPLSYINSLDKVSWYLIPSNALGSQRCGDR